MRFQWPWALLFPWYNDTGTLLSTEWYPDLEFPILCLPYNSFWPWPAACTEKNTSLPEFPNGYYSSWSTVMKESHSRSQMWGSNSPSTSLPTLGTMLMSIMPIPHGKGVELGDCRDYLRTVYITHKSLKQKSNKLACRSSSISKVLEAKHEDLSSIPNTSINSAVVQPACHNHCARRAAWGSQKLFLASQPSQSVSSRFNMRPYLKKWSG